MSKLYKKYKELKAINSEKLYLFEAGIFYILLDDDAKLTTEHIPLKLTNLNTSILKCGFPVSNLTKYAKQLTDCGFEFEIIDSNLQRNLPNKDYLTNLEIINKMNKIKKIDLNKTSPIDAFHILCDFKSILLKGNFYE